MQSSFRAMSLVFALAGSLVFCVGCSQGEGGRCEIDSDCASGLICSVTGSPHNGVCKAKTNPGPVSTADAASSGPVSTEDAANDAPAGTADAAGPADAAVAADGATVGVDTAPDADAAADLSVTD